MAQPDGRAALAELQRTGAVAGGVAWDPGRQPQATLDRDADNAITAMGRSVDDEHGVLANRMLRVEGVV